MVTSPVKACNDAVNLFLDLGSDAIIIEYYDGSKTGLTADVRGVDKFELYTLLNPQKKS